MTGSLRERAEGWLAEDPDPDTRAELRALLDAQEWPDIAERFGGRLTFGTAGLRGALGAGPNRMNRAVVRRAAAGVAAYLRQIGADGPVVIGYDARHKSRDFAHDSAAVFAGAGFDTWVLPQPLPTPVLAFAVRQLRASAGVMVTASHNPPADNGYKVYLGGAASPGGAAGDGAQIVPPADAGIEAAIAAVGPLSGIRLADGWRTAGPELLETYLERAATVPRTPHRTLRIAATALHGVGGQVLSHALRRAGFDEPAVVAEQAEPDPDFPTVAFPNPEEPGAVDLLLALAERTGAELAIANDPDADRCAVATGGRLLRGDELGVLLADHLIRHGARGTFATTVVSSSLLAAICADHQLPYTETLTGFKWIARAAEDLAFGYEEALGYAVAPDLVRDKDGITAALLAADLAAELRAEGKTLQDRLDELALRYGLHATDQLSIRVDDLSLITAAMHRIRAALPRTLLGEAVTEVVDRLPDADVLTLRTGGCRVVVRPSGTEPKLKSYLEVVVPVTGSVADARAGAAGLLARLRAETAAALGVDAG